MTVIFNQKLKNMNTKPSRRSALKNILGSAALISAPITFAEAFAANEKVLGAELNGKINHSACRWCYSKIPLEELCQEAVKMGLKSIELQGPDEWPILKKYGLTCAMPWGAGKGINDGFNDLKLHDELVKSYEEIFPKLKIDKFLINPTDDAVEFVAKQYEARQ